MNNTLKYLIEKEVLQIRRNKFLPRMILVFPIMIMCVMPWVMNMEIKNIVVDVVDNDRSTLSAQLVHSIEASDYFKFGGLKASYGEALDDVENSTADVVVEIPHGMECDMVRGEEPQILVAVNAVNGTKGSIGSSYMGGLITEKVAPTLSALQGKVSVLTLYNKHSNYKLFMIPSLIAIIMMLMCGFLPALNIVGEKEKGTIEAINVTPVSKGSFILAKLIPYWIMGLVVMTVCLVLSWALYGITSAGSLWLVYLLAMLLALMFSGFGLVVSNHNDTMQQAVFVMWFCVVCLLLLSGLFTPVRSMPHWAYLTTWVNPMCYFIDAVRTVFVRGGNLGSVAHQVLALIAFATAMNVWAVVSYKKNSGR
ncbi:MAG: ABC transporter permease [Sodaliphilus sp.]|nr:ABC transporter permease [Sodaliphilus sp.]